MNHAITDTASGVLHRAIEAETDRSQRAYRDLFGHAASCTECNAERRCEAGAQLRRAWREARS